MLSSSNFSRVPATVPTATPQSAGRRTPTVGHGQEGVVGQAIKEAVKERAGGGQRACIIHATTARDGQAAQRPLKQGALEGLLRAANHARVSRRIPVLFFSVSLRSPHCEALPTKRIAYAPLVAAGPPPPQLSSQTFLLATSLSTIARPRERPFIPSLCALAPHPEHLAPRTCPSPPHLPSPTAWP